MKHPKTFTWILFLAFGWILSSCQNHLGQSESGPGAGAGETTPRSEKAGPDFTLLRERVFAPRCLSCHLQYGTFDGVRRELAAIEDAVRTNRMPKTGGPLSDEQKDVLFAWIQQGAPEVSGPADAMPSKPPSAPEPLLPTWKSVSENIIYPKCLVCHNPQGQAKFLDLSTRQAVFSARNRKFATGETLLNFDDPEKSYLIQILRDPEEPMPPTWSNLSRLTETEIQILDEWIAQGLP